jgi:hypothetical protein
MIRRLRRRAPDGTQGYRYYVHVVDEWGLDKPLSVFRVRGMGGAVGEEEVAPGAVWKPTTYAFELATRTDGYSAVPVGARTAHRLAARWAYTYQRVVERSSGRTVAYVRSWVRPSVGVRLEESTCRSGVWESTERLRRIDAGLDDYAVKTVGAAAVEDYLRDLPQPDYRYFAVVGRGGTDYALHDPAEVLRVRAGQESGVRERLGTAWEPYDMIDGVRGLRAETLLEIDEAAVAAFGRRPASAKPAEPQDTGYEYYEILPADSDQPMAVVRRGADGGPEEAAVGWPVWYPSFWLKQIAEGRVLYRARRADAAAVARYLRRAAAEQPEYRYFAFLDTDDSIDSAGHMARMHCQKNGDPWKEETPRNDGSWAETYQLLEIDYGRGRWWIEPVEVPGWMFERYRAKRQGNASAA